MRVHRYNLTISLNYFFLIFQTETINSSLSSNFDLLCVVIAMLLDPSDYHTPNAVPIDVPTPFEVQTAAMFSDLRESDSCPMVVFLTTESFSGCTLPSSMVTSWTELNRSSGRFCESSSVL